MIQSFFWVLFVLFFTFPAQAKDIAKCGSSYGYSYYADRGGTRVDGLGWEKDQISKGQFTFIQKSDGAFDIISSHADGVTSAVDQGATLIPASISDEALTIILLYPNELTETYVFQKLRSGAFQAMWTQAKVETLVPKISALVSDCSYLDLESVTNK